MDKTFLNSVLEELLEIKGKLEIIDIDSNNKSLINLRQYVALRCLDLRETQKRLSTIGLSSLGRSQSCILSSLNKNIEILSKLLDRECNLDESSKSCSYEEAKDIMLKNSHIFSSKSNSEFNTKIMVTLPSEAQDKSTDIIKELIENGANILRINTAHDDKKAWQSMAEIIRKENQKQKKDTKIYVDLAGPKNRTGEIMKIFTPFSIGSWRNPQEVELVPISQKGSKTKKSVKDSCGAKTVATLVVSDEFFDLARIGRKLLIDDFERNRRQKYEIIKRDDRLFLNANKKIYIFENTKLYINDDYETLSTPLHNLEYLTQEIKLFREQEFILTPKETLGCYNYEYKDKIYAAIISCTNKEIFNHVKIGDEIFIDDGKIGCRVVDTNSLGLVCKVTLSKDMGTLLKEEKGINFPDTKLEIPAITEIDMKNLDVVSEFADIIGISFAQSKKDIKVLKKYLKSKDKKEVAIVPKIETKLAFKNLPEILEELIKWKSYALMIARGDLAIEVGFENLPYIQEEIFDICEAAHVPVIYATQILEAKMKTNLPSRAEVTDAAFAQRGDCVMLNKGPYVLDTLTTIKKILNQAHTIFEKNRQLLNICSNWR